MRRFDSCDTGMSSRLRIVIVEDHLMFREFIRSVLTQDFHYDVVGEAGDGIEALRICREHKPDLLVLDILIPRLSGLHVAKTVREEMPETRILMLSSECDASTLHQLHQIHVEGFIDKVEQNTQTLRKAIRTITEGGRYYSEVIQKTLNSLHKDPMAFQKILTPREMEVLSLVGGGLSDNEIGKMLGLSSMSIQSHRRNLFSKLNITTTPELVQFAHEHGFWKHQFNKMELTRSYHIFK